MRRQWLAVHLWFAASLEVVAVLDSYDRKFFEVIHESARICQLDQPYVRQP